MKTASFELGEFFGSSQYGFRIKSFSHALLTFDLETLYSIFKRDLKRDRIFPYIDIPDNKDF